MKKVYTILFFLAAFAKMQAQNAANLKMTPDTSVISGPADADVLKVDIEVENLDTKTRTIEWERIIVNMPTDWYNTVCDPTTCWAPLKATADFQMQGKATAGMILDVFPEKIKGNAYIKLIVREKGQTASIVGRYRFVASPVSISEKEAAALKVFPNPTSDYFVLEGEADLTKVQIQSIEGRIIRSFDYIPSEIYEIQDLPQGTYFVNLIGENNKRLATKRLVKQ